MQSRLNGSFHQKELPAWYGFQSTVSTVTPLPPARLVHPRRCPLRLCSRPLVAAKSAAALRPKAGDGRGLHSERHEGHGGLPQEHGRGLHQQGQRLGRLRKSKSPLVSGFTCFSVTTFHAIDFFFFLPLFLSLTHFLSFILFIFLFFSSSFS